MKVLGRPRLESDERLETDVALPSENGAAPLLTEIRRPESAKRQDEQNERTKTTKQNVEPHAHESDDEMSVAEGLSSGEEYNVETGGVTEYESPKKEPLIQVGERWYLELLESREPKRARHGQ